ncbi:hypothetical protein SAY87_020397 [Trapa incisa]|uniref:glucan endo-1,3-beta-D-glucosidase n=1 Tax=Trapa incisa TaxID=236973 RepID=A0AAN7K6N0_9MYRT|nr:hypothetical protein SAY87_020397 [Trapa incisa]
MAGAGLLLFLAVVLLTSICSVGVEHNSVGVNYGTVASNLPPPDRVARFLIESTVIGRVRLFDTNPDILKSFAQTGIEVSVTVPNNLIPRLTNLTYAQQWLRDNIQPYVPGTNIIRILVGNEVLSTASRQLIGSLVPAMQTLHAALVDASLDSQIKISTPHSLGILASSTPPGAGKFRQGYDTHVLKPMIEFLQATGSDFLVNPYPFFGCNSETLDYALFRPGNPGVIDDITGLHYTNMLDAQLDAVYSAMRLLGFGDVNIVIGETGWPSMGDSTQVGVDPDTAREYNTNLIQHVNSGDGTPLMPNRTFEAYIFALFNEDLKPGPTSERNFGLFRPDMTPVYDAGILRPLDRASVPGGSNPAPEPVSRIPPPQPESGKRFCLPMTGASPDSLQRNIDYVCGLGWVNCGPIKEGGACFEPDTVRAHAAYAMNVYYQTSGKNNYDCDFEGTGSISNVDPSEVYYSSILLGSVNASNPSTCFAIITE